MLARTLLAPLRRPLFLSAAAPRFLSTSTTTTSPAARALSLWRGIRPTVAVATTGTATTTAVQQQVRGMKVRSSVKKLCDGCKVRLINSPDNRPGGRCVGEKEERG